MLRIVVTVVLALGTWAAAAPAQNPQASPAEAAEPADPPPLRVVTKHSPPFAFEGAGGVWQGLSVDLWRRIAEDLGAEFELEVADTPDAIISGVGRGEWDVGVGALSVTAERIQRVEFTHPFYSTGLGIMTHGEAVGGFSGWVGALLSPGFLILVGSLLGGLLLVGVLIWLAERKTNPTFRDTKARSGVGNGLWWSTIMFLGHKGIFPTTAVGRTLAISTMIASVVLLSVLTGAIASQLTVAQLNTLVRSVADLDRVRTAAVQGTSGAAFLRAQRIRFEEVETIEEGVALLQERELDALVHDQPLLEYLLNDVDDLQVLPRTLDTQDYAFALRPDSALRKDTNAALLRIRNSAAWAEIRYQYLGR